MVEMAKYGDVEVHVLAPMYEKNADLSGFIDEGVHVHFFDPHVYPDKDPLLSRIFPGIKGKVRMLRFLLSFRKKALDLKREFGIELVHSHWLIPSGLVSYMIRPDIFVNTSYGSDVMLMPEKLFWRPVIRRILKRVNYQFAIGEVIRERSLKLGAAIAETIMPVPISKKQYDDLVSIPIEKHENEEVRILTVASLYPLKNISTLIQAVSELGDLQGVRLDIVGDGQSREELEELAKTSSIPVFFHGFQDRENSLRIISDSHISVLPSYSEGISSFLVESMLAGNLVIASDVGGTPTIVEDEKRLFPPNDLPRLVELLKTFIVDRDQRLNSVRHDRERAMSNFNPEETVSVLVERYRTLISSKARNIGQHDLH